MNSKFYRLAGLAAPVVFIITYLILSSWRVGYSHSTKAVSELGSVDAPYKLWWNLFGYILTGFLISVFSFSTGKKGWPFWGLMLCGGFMILSGIFPGDFEDRNSFTMIMHTIGSMGSYLFFLIATFTIGKYFKNKGAKVSDIRILLVFTWMTIVGGTLGATWLREIGKPALGQRITFFFFFLWIFYAALVLKNLKNLPGKLFLENKVNSQNQKDKTDQMIPPEGFIFEE